MTKKINSMLDISGVREINYSLAPHTTYRVGGPADFYFRPSTHADIKMIIKWAHVHALPFFTLGGGSNILISDSGIRGVVMDMSDMCEIDIHPSYCMFGAGINIQDAAMITACNGMGGLHHFYGMPGTLGGAVWMNARCYGKSIAELLLEVSYYDENGKEGCCIARMSDFDYKKSPFQHQDIVMSTITVRNTKADTNALKQKMFSYLCDRYQKGHYSAPSAGSVFKNNRIFGKPSGMIIDSLGLRGYRIGGAKISDVHANIFVNGGGASADDFRQLIEAVYQKVYHAYRIKLEREVQYVGDWSHTSP